MIISRTDSIGDVVLTLPVAGVLKEAYPDSEIVFLGNDYTREIVALSRHVDAFLDWGDLKKRDRPQQISELKAVDADAIIHVFPVKEIASLARKAKIPVRIGATGRLYHYFTCNKLVPLSRRRSELHEAQLNLKLVRPISPRVDFTLDEIPRYYGLKPPGPPPDEIAKRISTEKFNLVLHPKSRGSAREWGVENFGRLIEILPSDRFHVIITGTREDGEAIRGEILAKYPGITDTTGRLTLGQLFGLINVADGLIAASTGPLHIAAALGKIALGIYPTIRPMHPGRWAPVGRNASYLVADKDCSDCQKSLSCDRMHSIRPERVAEELMALIDRARRDTH